MGFRLGIWIVVGLLAAAVGPPAGAEIYKWTDESGRVHFTQDLNTVPGRHRAQAERAAKAPRGRDPIQTYAPVVRRKHSAPASIVSGGGATGRTHRIPVQRAGLSMRVMVRLNGNVTAPFIIDTGASLVALPRDVADQLGLDLRDARTARFNTANGVIESPLVTLDSVRLGTASANNVQASVLDGMSEGLLGLSFFNHFTYNVDSQRGLVTLIENDMEETGAIRGGRSELQWRSEYLSIQRRLDSVERARGQVPKSHSRRHDELDDEADELERQHALLDREADEAHVPFAWRD
jgi:clan AA aspartic protease (TIGR02281 family)